MPTAATFFLVDFGTAGRSGAEVYEATQIAGEVRRDILRILVCLSPCCPHQLVAVTKEVVGGLVSHPEQQCTQGNGGPDGFPMRFTGQLAAHGQ